MTRDEHIAWCKKRALEYLDAGDVRQGFTSMLSDLRKHPETEHHTGGELGVALLMLPGWITDPDEVRRWIEGFN